MAITKITGASIAADSIDGTKIADDAINSEHLTDGGIDNVHIGDVAATKLTGTIASGRLSASNLGSGTVPTARLGSGTASNTTFLRGDGSWQVVSVPKLDSPVITGTLSVNTSGTVSHTISNWSDDVSYTITPTNCTVGSVNSSGVFVVTHTSGTPSYTILATTASLGLDDSALVTKNLLINLTAPTLSSPADSQTSTNVVYTITSTTANDDKLILDPGTANFTYQSVSVGSGSKVGNTVELTGFTTNNPAVTIQFTAEATYSVTAKAVDTGGTYGDSDSSSADSIVIQNTYTVDYLVIAGGGGGGGDFGGGGGAGGYRHSWNSEASGGGSSSETALAVAPSTQYTVTVGAGGNGQTSSATGHSSGSNSVFGSITSLGGGYGNGDGIPSGASGGSGGGDRTSTSTRTSTCSISTARTTRCS
jgi:hypothetical protein